MKKEDPQHELLSLGLLYLLPILPYIGQRMEPFLSFALFNVYPSFGSLLTVSRHRSAKVRQLWTEKMDGILSNENGEDAEKQLELESCFNGDYSLRLVLDPERVALSEDGAILALIFKEYGPRRKNRLSVFAEICKKEDEYGYVTSVKSIGRTDSDKCDGDLF